MLSSIAKGPETARPIAGAQLDQAFGRALANPFSSRRVKSIVAESLALPEAFALRRSVWAVEARIFIGISLWNVDR
jgi:hypothetical protein